ncbi:MAG: hypothetical protein LKM45_00640 [Wolbachia endosymbiont of Alcedoecus sp.]|nr:hypothetical protein [Wolbachia endosymbiont of Alcedoecus sp.]
MPIQNPEVKLLLGNSKENGGTPPQNPEVKLSLDNLKENGDISHSIKGNKLPIITASAGLLLGLSIAYAYFCGAATIAVFVAAAAFGALIGYCFGKFCEKVSEERQKDRHMSIGTAITNVLIPECLKSQEEVPIAA